jgi:hypothetical protein
MLEDLALDQDSRSRKLGDVGCNRSELTPDVWPGARLADREPSRKHLESNNRELEVCERQSKHRPWIAFVSEIELGRAGKLCALPVKWREAGPLRWQPARM